MPNGKEVSTLSYVPGVLSGKEVPTLNYVREVMNETEYVHRPPIIFFSNRIICSLSFDVPIAYIDFIDKMWGKLLNVMKEKNKQQKESISKLHVGNDSTMRMLLESSFSLVYNYETYAVRFD